MSGKRAKVLWREAVKSGVADVRREYRRLKKEWARGAQK